MWNLLLLGCAGASLDNAAPEDTSAPAETEDTAPDWTWDGATTTGAGVAVEFALGGGSVVGAEVSSLELPSATTTTAEDGSFTLEVPSGGVASFTLSHPDAPPIQTATLQVPEGGLTGVTFQVPDHEMYALMEGFSEVEADDAACQIATTVTCAGCDMWHGAFHGEPGATVTIEPPLPEEAGPVYFYRNSENGLIWPDPDLTETTEDGGVLFLNVPPGEYVLTAHKDGVSFEARTMRCRAGWLVNASPPFGLQAY